MGQEDSVWKKGIKSVVNIVNSAIDFANELEIDDENLQFATNIRDGWRYAKKEEDEIVAHANKCLEYYCSEQREIELEKATKLKRSSKRIRVISSVLCIMLIVATISFCVTGNDLILTYLHL